MKLAVFITNFAPRDAKQCALAKTVYKSLLDISVNAAYLLFPISSAFFTSFITTSDITTLVYIVKRQPTVFEGNYIGNI